MSPHESGVFALDTQTSETAIDQWTLRTGDKGCASFSYPGQHSSTIAHDIESFAGLFSPITTGQAF